MAELSSHHPLHAGQPTDPRHVITLVKGEQRWRFHLERGREGEMIDLLSELALDPDHPLDWFDAAVVSHQITRHFETGPPADADDADSSSGQAA